MNSSWNRGELLQLGGILGTIFAAMIGLIVARMVRNVHVMINSRMSELLAGAKAQGVVGERAAADARQLAKVVADDARQDAIKN